jgi:hypothetical protein
MKHQLYRVKVRRILGQVAETCTDSLDRLGKLWEPLESNRGYWPNGPLPTKNRPLKGRCLDERLLFLLGSANATSQLSKTSVPDD